MFFRLTILPLLFLACNTVLSQTDIDTVNRVDEDGNKHGFWRKYNDKGMPKYQGYFVHGVPSGLFIYYYPDAIVKARSEFSDNGHKTHTITYHHNGKVMSDGYYYDKQKDSLWKYFDDHGILLKEEYYKDNMKEGVWKVYYGDGMVAEEKSYKAGKQDGPWKKYYPDGTLKMEACYENGERTGKYLVYYPSGNIEISGNYSKSIREGEWFYYNPEGKLVKKEIYTNGKLIKTIEGKKLEKEKR